jgi:hypothetical protein
MLTTFNEVDMSAVMALRNQYKDLFEKKHGVKLGFMGFFVKACVQALKEIPAVNAEIDGDDIVYKNYYHIGVAVGTERGLVVPVVRDADHVARRDREGHRRFRQARARRQLKIEEMQGGTFTISNGGVYGSLMSTPILNAPQSGILGMHKIQERPVVVGGKIEARPMMYLALSYDHRIVRRRIKEASDLPGARQGKGNAMAYDLRAPAPAAMSAASRRRRSTATSKGVEFLFKKNKIDRVSRHRPHPRAGQGRGHADDGKAETIEAKTHRHRHRLGRRTAAGASRSTRSGRDLDRRARA